MKFNYRKHSITVVCTVLFGAFVAVSCHNDSSDLTAQYMEDLQKQLDTTMKLYHQAKSENAGFDAQLASRDSAIQAQAQEIQRLINQLNEKPQGKKPVTTATGDSRQLEAQRKEIREKENKIKQLQQQLDQQGKQLKQLENNKKPATDNSKYETRIAALQKQIKEQESQISKLKASASASANCDQVRKTYESQVADYKGQVADYKGQIASLRDQISKLKSEVSACQKSMASQQTSTTADAETLKTLRGELTDATRELNECRKLNTQYQQEVKKAQDTLLIVKTLVSQLNVTKDNSKLAEENARLEQRIAECEGSRSALQNQIANLQQHVTSLSGQIETLTADNNTLRQSVQYASQQDASSTQTISQLQQQVAAQQAQIAQLQQQVEQQQQALNNASAQAQTPSTQAQTPNKDALDKKMSDLQALCNEYIAEIERLRAENARLKTENAELKDKIGQSGDLIAENERLQQKVKLASVLVTSDVVATPGKSIKAGNIVTPTNKASKTTVVRIDCKLLDNNVVDPGPITIYARIANAANRVVCNGSIDNYSFDLDGTTMQYTAKQDIEFTGYGRNLTMLWRRAETTELPAGLYWVTLYAGGYEIGKTSFKLD